MHRQTIFATIMASFVMRTIVPTLAQSDGGAFGDPRDWTFPDCRGCISNRIGACGLSWSVNNSEMVDCVCDSKAERSLLLCAERGCVFEEALRMERTLLSYCQRNGVQLESILKESGGGGSSSSVSSEGGSSSPTSRSSSATGSMLTTSTGEGAAVPSATGDWSRVALALGGGLAVLGL